MSRLQKSAAPPSPHASARPDPLNPLGRASIGREPQRAHRSRTRAGGSGRHGGKIALERKTRRSGLSGLAALRFACDDVRGRRPEQTKRRDRPAVRLGEGRVCAKSGRSCPQPFEIQNILKIMQICSRFNLTLLRIPWSTLGTKKATNTLFINIPIFLNLSGPMLRRVKFEM